MSQEQKTIGVDTVVTFHYTLRGEDGALLGGTEVQGLTAGDHLDRPQDPELRHTAQPPMREIRATSVP